MTALTDATDWSNLPDVYVTSAKLIDGIFWEITACSVPMAIGPEVRLVRADVAREQHLAEVGAVLAEAVKAVRSLWVFDEEGFLMERPTREQTADTILAINLDATAALARAEQAAYIKGLEASLNTVKSMCATDGLLTGQSLICSGLEIQLTKARAALVEVRLEQFITQQLAKEKS